MSMQLAAAVKKLVIHGQLHAGDVLPGIYELAAQCGSSVKVARRALELLAREGWTVPQRGVGSVVADCWADSHAAGRMLMYVRDTGWSYYTAKFVSAFSERIRSAGYGLTIVSAGGRSEAGPCRRMEALLEERWSLVLLMGGGDRVRQLAVASGLPFVLIGDGAKTVPCDSPGCIGCIQICSGKALPQFIRACASRNVRRVVQFLYDRGAFDVTQTLSNFGVEVKTVRVSRRSAPEDVSHGAMLAMRQFLGRRTSRDALPDVFLFTDDYVAQGALLALALAGVRVPEDVAVVTQSNKGLGPVWAKPLTRLEMDPVAHGREVARVVVGHLKSGAFPPSLVLGSVWKNGATF